jgi:hypothetical protein
MSLINYTFEQPGGGGTANVNIVEPLVSYHSPNGSSTPAVLVAGDFMNYNTVEGAPVAAIKEGEIYSGEIRGALIAGVDGNVNNEFRLFPILIDNETDYGSSFIPVGGYDSKDDSNSLLAVRNGFVGIGAQGEWGTAAPDPLRLDGNHNLKINQYNNTQAAAISSSSSFSDVALSVQNVVNSFNAVSGSKHIVATNTISDNAGNYLTYLVYEVYD